MFRATQALFMHKMSDADNNTPRTIVCGGVPRGGTSMVAGIIHGLGIPMGGDNLPVNIEDPAMNPDVLRQSEQGYDHQIFLDQTRAYIDKQNAALADWGWKFPRVNAYLPEIVQDLRNPSLILVYRDTVAASARGIEGIPKNAANRDKRVMDELKSREQIARRNTILIETCAIPTLLVSYERAMARPRPFIREIAAFLGKDVPADMDPLVQFMKPGSYKEPMRDL